MKQIRNLKFIIYLAIALTVSLAACDNDDAPKPSYEIPEEYNFENVKYTGQVVRLRLLDTLAKLINSAKTQHIDKTKLLSIYNNTNSLYGGTQKLSDKTAPGTEAQILAWFDSVATYSPMANPGSKDWFFTPGGLDISQLVQKTLMGSVFYYQATSTYLDGIENDDNNTVTEGEGTVMEHHWDEAFGYYGAPKDFGLYNAEDILLKYKDTNGNGKQDIPEEKYYFHASYSLTRDEGSKNFSGSDKTNFRKTLMESFLKGRAAISNKDFKGRDDARAIILSTWEKQTAASAIHYFNTVKKKIEVNSSAKDDIYELNHEWAEARGFFNSLKYNVNSIITASKWNEIDALLGNNPKESTVDDLTQAANKLKEVYGFSEFQRDNF